MKKAIAITIAWKTIKYPGVTLPKKVRDLYIEHYKNDKRDERKHK